MKMNKKAINFGIALIVVGVVVLVIGRWDLVGQENDLYLLGECKNERYYQMVSK